MAQKINDASHRPDNQGRISETPMGGTRTVVAKNLTIYLEECEILLNFELEKRINGVSRG